MSQVQNVLQVHHTAKLPDGSEKITRVTPYVIVGGPDGKLFLKNGQILDEGGTVQEEIPAWLADALTRMTPSVLNEIGFTDRVPTRDTSKKK